MRQEEVRKSTLLSFSLALVLSLCCAADARGFDDETSSSSRRSSTTSGRNPLRIMAVGDSITEGVLGKLTKTQIRRLRRVGLPANYSKSSYLCDLQSMVRQDLLDRRKIRRGRSSSSSSSSSSPSYQYYSDVLFVGPNRGYCDPHTDTGDATNRARGTTSRVGGLDDGILGHAAKHATTADSFLWAIDDPTGRQMMQRETSRLDAAASRRTRPRILDWMSTFQPNVVLLLAGTNDVVKGRTPTEIASTLSQIVVTVLQAHIPPLVESADSASRGGENNLQGILIGTLLPIGANEPRCYLSDRRDCPKLVEEVNLLLKTKFCSMVESSLQTDISRRSSNNNHLPVVAIVEMPSNDLDFDNRTHFVDTLHPSFALEKWMAERWFTALSKVGVLEGSSSIVEEVQKDRSSGGVSSRITQESGSFSVLKCPLLTPRELPLYQGGKNEDDTTTEKIAGDVTQQSFVDPKIFHTSLRSMDSSSSSVPHDSADAPQLEHRRSHDRKRSKDSESPLVPLTPSRSVIERSFDVLPIAALLSLPIFVVLRYLCR